MTSGSFFLRRCGGVPGDCAIFTYSNRRNVAVDSAAGDDGAHGIVTPGSSALSTISAGSAETRLVRLV